MKNGSFDMDEQPENSKLDEESLKETFNKHYTITSKESYPDVKFRKTNRLSLKMQKKPLVLPKVLRKEFSILGDYLFCFHNDFKDSNTLKSLSNLRGLKYFLAGFKETQNDINSFILKCKESENEKGYLSSDFYDLKTNSIYKLVSGPFANSIFKLVKLQKNKIDILMGNIKTTIKKKDFLFQPV